jgi:hypothetical protein
LSRSPGVFRARPLAWLVGISVAATLAAVVLLAFGGDVAGGVTAGHGTRSDSADISCGGRAHQTAKGQGPMFSWVKRLVKEPVLV